MKQSILIIDDDPAVRSALGNLLHHEGYRVALAASGQEAIERVVRDGPFDLLLLDLNLCGMDGWETFDRIALINPLLPVLLITARPEQESAARASGVSGLAEKPFDMPHLLGTVRDLIAEPPIQRLRRLSGAVRSMRYLPSEPTSTASPHVAAA